MAISPDFLKSEFKNMVDRIEKQVDSKLPEIGPIGCIPLDPIFGPREPHLRSDREFLTRVENELLMRYLKAGWKAGVFKIEWYEDQHEGSWWQIQFKMVA